MSEVTEGDRVTAMRVVEGITDAPWDVFSDAEWKWVDHVAAALAAEREKAQAPFLELAAELSSGSTGNRETAELIRAVAKGKSLAEWRAEDDQ